MTLLPRCCQHPRREGSCQGHRTVPAVLGRTAWCNRERGQPQCRLCLHCVPQGSLQHCLRPPHSRLRRPVSWLPGLWFPKVHSQCDDSLLLSLCPLLPHLLISSLERPSLPFLLLSFFCAKLKQTISCTLAPWGYPPILMAGPGVFDSYLVSKVGF